MNEITWLNGRETNLPYLAPKDADVHVRFTRTTPDKYGKVYDRICIIFYNDSEMKISHTGKMLIGFDFGTPKQIYLKEVPNCGKGVLIRKNGKSKNSKLVSMSINDVIHNFNKKEEFEGYFKLTYDTINQLWRINTENRVEK